MGLGGTITGAMGLMDAGPKIDTPNPWDVGRKYQDMLTTFRGAQPDIWKTEYGFKPAYATLDSSLYQGNVTQGTATGVNALRSASPGLAALYDKLSQQAGEGLNAGASLDPSLARVTSQGIRGAQAARGLGYGPGDAVQEDVALTQLGQQLRQQRQQFGLQTAAEGGQLYTNPALQVGLGAGNAALNSGPSIIPSGQNYDMLNTMFNAQAGANIGNANSQMALLQGFNSFD